LIENTKFANAVRMRGLDPEMKMTSREFTIIKDLLNWIEDRRIDYYIYTTAPGYRMYYEAMYDKYFNDKIVDKALKTNEKCDESWDDYFFHIINFTNPNRNLDALKQLRSIWAMIDLRNISRLQSTDDALSVAIEVYKAIKDAVAETEMPGINGQAQGQGQAGEGLIGGGGDGLGEPVDINEDDESEDDGEGDEEGDGGGSELTQRELEKLQKAIDKQRQFLNGDAKKSGKITKKNASIINALRDSDTNIKQVDTSAEGAGSANFVDTVVIKKLTPGIICSLSGIFATNSEEYASGKRDYDADVKKGSYYARRLQDTDNAVMKVIILGKQLGRKLQVRDA